MQPNLFIVGSMKCGTSALHGFLSKHPQISGSNPKEIHYFTMHHERGEEWYLSHFKSDTDTKFLVEASPTYLDTAWTTEIPQRIIRFNPDAKIIILIRDPLLRAVSHFHHLRAYSKIPEFQLLSFTQFIRREWPATLETSVLERQYSNVTRFSFYQKKIENYAQVFGKGNVFLIENEVLNSNSALVVNSLFSKLGLHSLDEGSISGKIFVGDQKLPQDVTDNRSYFDEIYAEDYRAARTTQSVTRIAIE